MTYLSLSFCIGFIISRCDYRSFITVIYHIFLFVLERPQKEKPDQSTAPTLVNEKDREVIPWRNRRTQAYQHDPQHETHDCPAHHKCFNKYDPPIKPSLTDEYAQINRHFYQTEHPDCQKHHLCPNNQDRLPLTDSCTQTNELLIALLEYVDIPIESILTNAFDEKPVPLVDLKHQTEYFDQYKYPLMQNLTDSLILFSQDEISDTRKNSNYFRIEEKQINLNYF
jgi:hypothetical protein